MDKEAARELVKELAATLESPTAFPIIPLVRKAIRLAITVDAASHRTLFELHLDGLEPDGKGLARVSATTPAGKSECIARAISDRSVDDGSNFWNPPLEQLEWTLTALREALTNGSLSGDERLRQLATIAAFERVETRIRNRVGVFVGDVVRLLCDPAAGEPQLSIGLRAKVFIGHGGSPVWTVLRDFLVELGLDYIEFNSESQAGNTTCARLEEMLKLSCFAFLVMTGEDARPDGKAHARENVIHETGLFQGKLGFKKAIVLLEDGCAQFSNILGLTYIGFPKGKIMASAEEIRNVLDREQVLLRSAD